MWGCGGGKTWGTRSWRPWGGTEGGNLTRGTWGSLSGWTKTKPRAKISVFLLIIVLCCTVHVFLVLDGSDFVCGLVGGGRIEAQTTTGQGAWTHCLNENLVLGILSQFKKLMETKSYGDETKHGPVDLSRLDIA